MACVVLFDIPGCPGFELQKPNGFLGLELSDSFVESDYWIFRKLGEDCEACADDGT